MTDVMEPSPLNGYKQEIADWWTKDSAYYDNYPEHGLTSTEEESWEKFFMEEIDGSQRRILDVGTGTGSLSLILAGLGHQVTGIDLSEGMLECCKKKAEMRNLPISLQIGDAEALPFPDQSFDLVTSRWVLWTLLHPDIAISEWKRVLKPNGVILAFDVPSPNYGHEPILERLRKYCSRVLIALHDGRSLNSYRYKEEITDHLPLSYKNPDAFSRQLDLFRDAGFSEVTVKKVKPLAELSSRSLDKPWRYRFGWKGHGDWHCIISRNPGVAEE